MQSTFIQNSMFLNLSLLVRAANTTFNEATESSQTVLQCNDIRHCRTLQSIIYGCFSTVFLCTWTALHLDAPYPPLLRRVRWMMVALVAPEIIFMNAFYDWTISSDLLKKILKNYPKCGWTETHAQFVRMGGFRLVDANGKMFRDCVKNGTINLPKVSKDEILGRSKGDLIAKSFAVIQTAWFVAQCICRRSQDLLLTELEITTLAHTLISFFIYFFWWHKPYEVTIPIEVPFKERRPEAIRGRDYNVEPRGGSYTNRNDYIQVPQTSNGIPSTSPPLSWYTRLGIKTLSVSEPKQLSILGRIVLSTIYFIVGGAFGAMHCLTWNSAFPTRTETHTWQISSSAVTVIGGTTLVYLINDSEVDCFLHRNVTAGRLVGKILFFILISMYCLARISLLILALLQLRALPYAGYETPSWTIFSPHIG
ncbi:hypothetical protein JOM56_014005 [Amanita muscaria]